MAARRARMQTMGRFGFPLVLVALLATSAQAAPALTETDKVAAFNAAGFHREGGQWLRCEDRQTSSRTPGAIEADDLNGDGRPEAWITESSTFCYGNTAEAFVLVTKTPRGWTALLDEVGIATAQRTKTAGWPDIEVGGPGLGPFPVYRFNGTNYRRRP
jgi:hypothetical protein